MSKELVKRSSPYYRRLVTRVREKTEKFRELEPGSLKNYDCEKIMKDNYYLYKYEVADIPRVCTCGKTGIINLYWMKIRKKYRKENEKSPVFLVGSKCIKQFNDAKSVALMHLLEQGKNPK